MVDVSHPIYLNYTALVRELGTLRAARDDLFDWILTLGPSARYNLTSSGLPEPELGALGIDTSFEHFAAEEDTHEADFAQEVAKLYHVEPGDVIVTAGGTEAIFLAYSVFGTGRAVVPLPNYPAMFTVPRALGMKVEGFSTPRKLGGAMLGLTDPNNPTGSILERATVEGLIESSKRGGGMVYVNETYREFAFTNPGTHFDGSGRVLTSGTMTKFFGLGRLRVGWILADSRNRRKLLYGKWALSGHDSEYSLWIAAQVLRRRRSFVERARRICTGNAALVRRFLEETRGVSADLGVAPFCLVRYKKGLASVPLARSILEKTKVLVSPGDFFGAPHSFRLCFTAREPILKGGLRALSAFLNGVR